MKSKAYSGNPEDDTVMTDFLGENYDYVVYLASHEIAPEVSYKGKHLPLPKEKREAVAIAIRKIEKMDFSGAKMEDIARVRDFLDPSKNEDIAQFCTPDMPQRIGKNLSFAGNWVIGAGVLCFAPVLFGVSVPFMLGLGIAALGGMMKGGEILLDSADKFLRKPEEDIIHCETPFDRMNHLEKLHKKITAAEKECLFRGEIEAALNVKGLNPEVLATSLVAQAKEFFRVKAPETALPQDPETAALLTQRPENFTTSSPAEKDASLAEKAEAAVNAGTTSEIVVEPLPTIKKTQFNPGRKNG